MNDYHINVFHSDEDGGYIADVPNLESCSAFGSTAQEALSEVLHTKEVWLAAARDHGMRSPSHATARRCTPYPGCTGEDLVMLSRD